MKDFADLNGYVGPLPSIFVGGPIESGEGTFDERAGERAVFADKVARAFLCSVYNPVAAFLSTLAGFADDRFPRDTFQPALAETNKHAVILSDLAIFDCRGCTGFGTAAEMVTCEFKGVPYFVLLNDDDSDVSIRGYYRHATVIQGVRAWDWLWEQFPAVWWGVILARQGLMEIKSINAFLSGVPEPMRSILAGKFSEKPTPS